ncbi:type III-B CRISPR module RAMP protein Cmr1 [Clostridium botulinum]|uniref:type III-B CRISPR module RAMP protein Cmr1 n=1 Tax=Clostridium botulinum TaxID=1491 RepID=UPI0007DFA76D|nr:type III-B CRISPR module RAMP protein Cmr1 [Clostridium botulinum]KEI87412.1 hypothetical protein N492_10515 [Clostridium botulinum B2 267]MBY6799946.1 type III-B CRISPR module RAMP protein Cmr1 [Clostridium botulinum]NFC29690.1 type III-B CRISPR module RAMP protein Cmr1 [Clostridium botulinum]NFC61457.1 type III-B CRISPR module RAMP protein Cmr1 [Clostridium botulinum]NFC68293.1 type III-B CRISPR module RAMP protein Cmr1 [Clostridium botulinum]
MKKAEVTLEVITPMLSFGDDGKNPEFRITELKSLMTNTFRELYYFRDKKDMRIKEGILFGNMDRKAPICFKIKSVELNDKYTEDVYMLPHKRQGRTNSIFNSSKIILLILGNDNKVLNMYINLLIQASVIGALGKRSRKGFGSFKITDIDGIEIDTFKRILEKKPIEILRECSKWVDRNIKSLYPIRIFKNDNKRIEKLDFDYPYAKKIKILKIPKNKNYKSLIESISKLTHYRLCNKKDCNKDFVYKIENSNQINRNILGNCRGQQVKINRFASPISVSFWENSNDKYMIIKQLNYNYIFGRLQIQDNESIKANEDYINKYIKKLVKIGDDEK